MHTIRQPSYDPKTLDTCMYMYVYLWVHACTFTGVPFSSLPACVLFEVVYSMISMAIDCSTFYLCAYIHTYMYAC